MRRPACARARTARAASRRDSRRAARRRRPPRPGRRSRRGFPGPGSQTMTSPPPYSPAGMTPSKSAYSIGWSSTFTASRRTLGSSVGPFGTAQLTSTPSSSRPQVVVQLGPRRAARRGERLAAPAADGARAPRRLQTCEKSRLLTVPAPTRRAGRQPSASTTSHKDARRHRAPLPPVRPGVGLDVRTRGTEAGPRSVRPGDTARPPGRGAPGRWARLAACRSPGSPAAAGPRSRAAGRFAPMRWFIAGPEPFRRGRVTAHVRMGTRQVIVLGAGLDTLAYRWCPRRERGSSRSTAPRRRSGSAAAGDRGRRPEHLVYVGVDLAHEDLAGARGAGFAAGDDGRALARRACVPEPRRRHRDARALAGLGTSTSSSTTASRSPTAPARAAMVEVAAARVAGAADHGSPSSRLCTYPPPAGTGLCSSWTWTRHVDRLGSRRLAPDAAAPHLVRARHHHQRGRHDQREEGRTAGRPVRGDIYVAPPTSLPGGPCSRRSCSSRRRRCSPGWP